MYHGSKIDALLLTIKQLSGVVRATNPIPSINAYEKTLVEIAIGDLRKNIEKGVEFARSAEPAKL